MWIIVTASSGEPLLTWLIVSSQSLMYLLDSSMGADVLTMSHTLCVTGYTGCKFGSGLRSCAPCLIIKHKINLHQPTSQDPACSRRPSSIATLFGLRYVTCWLSQDRRRNLVNDLSLSPDRLPGTLYRTLSRPQITSAFSSPYLKTSLFGISRNVWTLPKSLCFQLCCVYGAI